LIDKSGIDPSTGIILEILIVQAGRIASGVLFAPANLESSFSQGSQVSLQAPSDTNQPGILILKQENCVNESVGAILFGEVLLQIRSIMVAEGTRSSSISRGQDLDLVLPPAVIPSFLALFKIMIRGNVRVRSLETAVSAVIDNHACLNRDQ